MGKEYEVSRVTVEHAFRYLETLGVILPASPGKKREINREVLRSVLEMRNAGQKRVLFLTKDPEANPAFMTKEFFDLLHHRCEREKISLDYLQVSPSAMDCRQMVEALKPDGMVMHILEEGHVRGLATLAVPCVSIGSGADGIPSMSTSYSHLLTGAFHCAWRVGHQRVVAPLWNKPESLRDALAGVLESVFDRAGVAFSKNYHLPLISGESPEEYARYLEKAFQHTPPTCLVLGNFSQYLMAVSYFLSHGIRIPDDVSIMLLSHDRMFDFVRPSIAHFYHPVELAVDRTFELLTRQMQGERISGHTGLDPIWVPGDSLAHLA